MTSPASRLLERELVTLVERLAAEHPEIAIGTITRAVRSAAPPPGQCDLRMISTVVTAVEAAARHSLLPANWHAA
jgi:hypothetical protein